jgi:hypothetical protein
MRENSDKKDIAQQQNIDLKKGGALNPQTPPGSLRLIWAPPPLPPPYPCAVAVSRLAPVALFYDWLSMVVFACSVSACLSMPAVRSRPDDT